MKYSNHTLWLRLLSFRFDSSFAGRLARDSGWSAGFADRAIDEYRKFLFLCGVSCASLSPSKAIDEVWHLHLLYTKSYWHDLCGTVLERELHHVPGDDSEAQKPLLKNQYEHTLELYHNWFGEEAPADLWPRPRNTDTDTALSPRPQLRRLPASSSVVLCTSTVFLAAVLMSMAGLSLLFIILAVAGVVVWGLLHIRKNERQRRLKKKKRQKTRDAGVDGAACAGMLFLGMDSDTDSGNDSSCSSDGGGCSSGCGGGCGGD